MQESFDVVIIGAGPAGIAAAIYTSRSNLKVAIVEKEMPGWQVNKTFVVENYPGYEKISGPDLVEKFYKQLNSLEVTQIFSEVTDIKVNKILTEDEMLGAIATAQEVINSSVEEIKKFVKKVKIMNLKARVVNLFVKKVKNIILKIILVNLFVEHMKFMIMKLVNVNLHVL